MDFERLKAKLDELENSSIDEDGAVLNKPYSSFRFPDQVSGDEKARSISVLASSTDTEHPFKGKLVGGCGEDLENNKTAIDEDYVTQLAREFAEFLHHEPVEEAGLADLGSKIAQGAGKVAKGIGAVAGAVSGVKQAYQQGKAAGTAAGTGAVSDVRQAYQQGKAASASTVTGQPQAQTAQTSAQPRTQQAAPAPAEQADISVVAANIVKTLGLPIKPGALVTAFNKPSAQGNKILADAFRSLANANPAVTGKVAAQLKKISAAPTPAPTASGRVYSQNPEAVRSRTRRATAKNKQTQPTAESFRLGRF